MIATRDIFTLLFLLIGGSLISQNTPSFHTYEVLDSRCSIDLPAKPDPVTVDYSLDSSLVYTIESLDSSTGTYYHFGAIVVHLNMMTLLDEEEVPMIESYLDYLKTTFNVVTSTGYVTGKILPGHPTASGVSDQWTDLEGDSWSVVGWAAEDFVVVQFLYGLGTYPDKKVSDQFFEGFRFPGDVK